MRQAIGRFAPRLRFSSQRWCADQPRSGSAVGRSGGPRRLELGLELEQDARGIRDGPRRKRGRRQNVDGHVMNAVIGRFLRPEFPRLRLAALEAVMHRPESASHRTRAWPDATDALAFHRITLATGGPNRRGASSMHTWPPLGLFMAQMCA
jgi:hypothetical protein